MDWDVKTPDVIVGHYFTNSHTLSEKKDNNNIGYTNKNDVNIPNLY